MDSPLTLSREVVYNKTPANVLERQVRYREKAGKELLRERVRRSRSKRTVKQREYERNLNQRNRIQALMFLGGKCNHCGINDIRVLQVDHVNGNGTKENKKIHARGVVMRVMESPNDYQILCANCNWIKRWERGENKKRKD
jgi:hypothetical protein